MRGEFSGVAGMLAATMAFVTMLSTAAAFGQAIVGPEGLIVVPDNLPSKTTNIELTVIALDRELFARPAGRAPEFEFGPGITVKSVSIESGKMARVVVDTADTAFGTIEARVKIYSLDASTVTVVSNTYVGATGPVSNGGLTVRALKNSRVEIDSVVGQTIGAIELTGPLSGPVAVDCPTGATIAAGRTPTVRSQTVGASVTGLTVNADRSGFTFNVTNATFSTITVAVSEVVLDLRSFTAAGGERGDVPMTYTVTGISQSQSISSAHTGGQTVENPTDEYLAPPTGNSNPSTQSPTAGLPPEDNPDSSGSNSGVTSGSSNNLRSPSSSSSSNSRTNANEDSANRANQRNNRGNRANRGNRFRSSGNSNQLQVRPNNATAFGSNNRAAVQPAIGRGASGENLGVAENGNAEARPVEGNRAPPPPAIAATPPVATGRILTPSNQGQKVVRVESFVLCDERFMPLPALGFKSAGDGTFKARVWVQLVLNTVLTKGMENRLEVMIQVPNAQPIRTILYETGPNSGVYRCAPEGVELSIALGD